MSELKITLNRATLPTLVLDKFADGAVLSVRGEENRRRTAGRTAAGALRASGGGYRPTCRWAVSAWVSDDEKLILEEMLALQETSPATPIYLTDEFEYLSNTKGAFYPTRVLVSGSTYTAPNGLQQSFYTFPTYLDLPDPVFAEKVTFNIWVVTLQFMEDV
ncbi:MAG TPA: hypothetical protein V6C57_19875 [Coleofasciculaceae cyanobacterium]